MPVINDFLVGYIQGAQYADSDVKIAISYANSFKDSAKCKELSLSMFNQGSDIGFNVAGAAGAGLIEAIANNTQQLAIPAEFIQTIPYIATLVLLGTSSYRRLNERKIKKIELSRKVVKN